MIKSRSCITDLFVMKHVALNLPEYKVFLTDWNIV